MLKSIQNYSRSLYWLGLGNTKAELSAPKRRKLLDIGIFKIVFPSLLFLILEKERVLGSQDNLGLPGEQSGFLLLLFSC